MANNLRYECQCNLCIRCRCDLCKRPEYRWFHGVKKNFFKQRIVIFHESLPKKYIVISPQCMQLKENVEYNLLFWSPTCWKDPILLPRIDEAEERFEADFELVYNGDWLIEIFYYEKIGDDLITDLVAIDDEWQKISLD
jgi:hypothetical protein